MTEPTETASLPADLSTLTSQERVNHILAIRRRVQEDPKSVSDDEIRDAVRLIRLNRAEPRSRKSSTKKTISLSDF